MNTKFYAHYKKMLEQEYALKRGGAVKPVWELIHDKELTVCPAFKGKNFDDSNLKLMVVGRAVNGWDVDTALCTSLENTVNMVMNQKDRFDHIICTKGIKYFDENTKQSKKYYYSRSRFWKLIRYIFEENGEETDFNHKIVWSNLYKVSPYVNGNPGWRLVKPQMQTYIDCLRDEINEYRPNNILFITGMDYLNPWPNEPQFGNAFKIGNNNQIDFTESSYETGIFENSKIVVCGRPETKSDEAIRNMAKEILTLFKTV